VPPAALSIHQAIGQAYAWSVFKPPLEAGLGISGVASALPFTLGIIMLGLSAALFGTKVDANGPRWAMVISSACFVSGFLISALGLYLRQYWMVVLGYGFVGGIAQTFLVMGLIYAVFMSVGWLLIRVPAPDWRPAGWHPDQSKTGRLITTANVSAANAIKTPSFWLLWVVLCFNVTAGIGILERAAPIYRDFFPDAASPQALAAAAAGFVAILSLANSLGRILWSTTSDFLGRKNMYRIYLGVGALLYLAVTLTTNANKVVFLLCTIVILSFYGAGFATVPAYLRDLFGTYQVGAIHGRLLTAWSTAGVLGPLIVNAIADAQIRAGVAGPGRYTLSFSIMVGLLVIGFVCNELIRPVADKYHERDRSRSATTTGAQA
jgi:hypothetical protein